MLNSKLSLLNEICLYVLLFFFFIFATCEGYLHHD